MPISEFDAPLLRSESFFALLNDMDGGLSMIKRSGNDYIAINSKRLSFKCAFNYTAKTTLANFLKSNKMACDGVTKGKTSYISSTFYPSFLPGIFPYAACQYKQDLQRPLTSLTVPEFDNILTKKNSLEELNGGNLEENLAQLKTQWANDDLTSL